MSAVILDTETTDTDEEAHVIEFACTTPLDSPQAVMLDSNHRVSIFDARFSSDRPIALGAMAAHHILDEDLVGLRRFTGLDLSTGIEYIIGHNIDFDWRMMGRPKVRRICTLALARSLWPQFDSHSLAAVAYGVSRDRHLLRPLLRNAHAAKVDVEIVLGTVLPEILAKLHPRAGTWEALWMISEDARIPSALTFGKYKGVPLGDVPQDYKRWLLNQPDIDPYVAVALRRR